MPKKVEIGIFNTARTMVDKEEVKKWMDWIGANDFEIPNEDILSNPALNIALAAKRCYMSFEPGLNPNITKVRKNYVDYFDNILKSGHGSVLEHSVYTFALEGVSRVFTAEMNRHRAGWAISEGSLRYIRFDKQIPYWLPTSLRVEESDNEDLRIRKLRSQDVFTKAFENQEKYYKELLDIWDMDSQSNNFHYKKIVTSCMRRIIGLGVATGGVWSGNMRALRHVIAMRTNKVAAEEEIYHVFCRIAQIMIEKEPLLFGDFHMDKTGSYVPVSWKV